MNRRLLDVILAAVSVISLAAFGIAYPPLFTFWKRNAPIAPWLPTIFQSPLGSVLLATLLMAPGVLGASSLKKGFTVLAVEVFFTPLPIVFSKYVLGIQSPLGAPLKLHQFEPQYDYFNMAFDYVFVLIHFAMAAVPLIMLKLTLEHLVNRPTSSTR
jgi:hypothetical protein